MPVLREHPDGSREILHHGYAATYSADELAEMRTLPETKEGEKVARMIHDAKSFLDATLLPSE